LSTTDLSSIIIVACTVVYTLGTLFLWYLTNKNILLVKQQIEIQNAASRSTAWHTLLDSHRDLYLEIIGNEELLTLFSKETNIEANEVRKKYLATLMINHALRIFLDYQNKLDIPDERQGFVNDLRSMLKYGFVQARWDEIRSFYPHSFTTFIDGVKNQPRNSASHFQSASPLSHQPTKH